MKINATIRRHGDSFLVLKLAVSVTLAARSRLLHYINLRSETTFDTYHAFSGVGCMQFLGDALLELSHADPICYPL